jgi:hypothetical protein
MSITRRGFLASMIALAGTAALPARSALRQAIKLSGPIFTAEMTTEADPIWLHDCAFNCRWHIDRLGFDGRPLIRHQMTGLAYVAFSDEKGRTAVQQIDAACCVCNEDLDPDYIVSHAARLIAEAALETFTDWQTRHKGPVYFRFSMRQREAFFYQPDEAEPDIGDLETEDAPEIVLNPFADDEEPAETEIV